MKHRNYVMALIAKNDPTRYRTRSVEAEHIKIQKNRARRRAAERKELIEIQAVGKAEHQSIAPKLLGHHTAA